MNGTENWGRESTKGRGRCLCGTFQICKSLHLSAVVADKHRGGRGRLLAAVGRFRTFSDFCRMLNFIYKCAFTKAERSGRERKATEALRTERDIA